MPADFPLPNYILKRKFRNKRERDLAIIKFRVRIAALYATEAGSMNQLALLVGFDTARSLATVMGREPLALKNCILIEKLVGPEIMSRQLLRPDLPHLKS